jgi:hypothetical protein
VDDIRTVVTLNNLGVHCARMEEFDTSHTHHTHHTPDTSHTYTRYIDKALTYLSRSYNTRLSVYGPTHEATVSAGRNLHYVRERAKSMPELAGVSGL